MRKKIVAGNWKMNKSLQDGIALASEVEQLVSSLPGNVEVIVAPPFLHLTEVKKVVKKVAVSAQNCASELSGAFTGEVSAAMLNSAGIPYAIIGHSERRTYYGETDTILARKVKLALDNGISPIFCCGELLAEREKGIFFEVVKRQIEMALFSLSETEFSRVIIAYEPVWAIGTGLNATPQQAQEMHKFIRDTIKAKFGDVAAQNTSILYGGSCKASNAGELFANPDVDGGLIGGASLQAQDFIGIVKAF
jgi:triosephosphate isomerase